MYKKIAEHPQVAMAFPNYFYVDKSGSIIDQEKRYGLKIEMFLYEVLVQQNLLETENTSEK